MNHVIDNTNNAYKDQLICEAETALLNYFGLEPSMDSVESSEFEEKAGFSMSEAINPMSSNFLLNDMAEYFEGCMEYHNEHGGRIAASAAWEMAVERFLN